MATMTSRFDIHIYDDELVAIFGPCRRTGEWNKVSNWIHIANKKAKEYETKILAMCRFVNDRGEEMRRQRYLLVESCSRDKITQFSNQLSASRGHVKKKIGKLILAKILSGQGKQLSWPEEWLQECSLS